MDKFLSWPNYLAARVNQECFKSCSSHCTKAFSDQRKMIRQLVAKVSPKSIACLGSGYLNDIPIDVMFEEGKDIALVDWIDGISKEGVRGRIISRSKYSYECFFCHKCVGTMYCKNFTGKLLSEGVCTAFVLEAKPVLTCKNYEPNIEPKFIRSDITAGVASGFAESMQRKINSCKTPKEAFLKAIKICDQNKGNYRPIPLNDSSIDLLTSSMIVSQFDVEPYTFFSFLLERRFGREKILSLDEILMPLVGQLRTKLFAAQAEAHIREMYRMIRKDRKGRVYFSVELFRSFTDRNEYFMVQDIPKAMDILGRYFTFEFDCISESNVLRKTKIGQGTSIIQNYVLVPERKPRVGLD